MLQAGTRLGPYEIISPLGASRMGEVYRAIDPRLDRHVAIKVLPEHLVNDTAALGRFEREVKAIAVLSHPNILSIHDFGTDRGIAYETCGPRCRVWSRYETGHDIPRKEMIREVLDWLDRYLGPVQP